MKTKFLLLKLFSVLLLFTAENMCVDAQNVIKFENQIPRCDDKTEKQQVSYVPSGDSGEDIIWDFSEVINKGDYLSTYYFESDSVILYEMTPKCINKYKILSDSLYLMGYEMPYQTINYNNPIIKMAYPFAYGQTIEGIYSGNGKYCNTKALQSYGSVFLEADATGVMYLSDIDTLRNVIRVHCIRSGSLGMCNIGDTVKMSRDDMKQEIEERYQWYAQGYRYPIFETISLSYYDNMDLVSCKQTAFRYLPDMQRLLNDEKNEESFLDNEGNNKNNDIKSDIFHYKISTNSQTIHINYDLDKEANITILVCNYMGVTYKRYTKKIASGRNYEMDIDCSRLTPDIYVLYINVNGKIYNEKVNLKY